MSSLRDRVLAFLRDDYAAHRATSLDSHLGAYKYDEHEGAFRVRLKRLIADDQLVEAQRWLVFHGHLSPCAPLSRSALKHEAARALAATPDGTAARRRGNLCERLMECALDASLGTALEDADVQQRRRQLAESDYAKQRRPRWPAFALQGESYDQLISQLVGAEAEAWLYDAGCPLAEQQRRAQQTAEEEDWEAAVKEPGRSAGTEAPANDPALVEAPRKPRTDAIPLGLVERYQHAVYGNGPAAPAAPAAPDPAAPGTPAPTATTPSSGPQDDDLQSQIEQLWKALSHEPESFSDVLVPLATDERSGAGLYLIGPDLLEGADYTVHAWCGPHARFKLQSAGPQDFYLGIVRRSDEPDLNALPFPLAQTRAGVGDTRLENMSVEVLAPERSVPLTVANGLNAFRDQCAASPQYHAGLAFYRRTNLYRPPECPDRFRALFADDDF